jgi:hypothetical protein
VCAPLALRLDGLQDRAGRILVHCFKLGDADTQPHDLVRCLSAILIWLACDPCRTSIAVAVSYYSAAVC